MWPLKKLVLNKVLEGKKDFGYDAKGDVYVDMLEALFTLLVMFFRLLSIDFLPIKTN